MKALITGITGQDGSYLADYLLSLGYEVVGMDRRKSVPNDRNIAHIRDDIEIILGDLGDSNSLCRLVEREFDEIYNLAAQSHVAVSFDQPEYTWDVNAHGVVRMLEAIRHHCPITRFYQASTSEMFGGAKAEAYTEAHCLEPKSPYGVAKMAAHEAVRVWRESYGLQACSGILFNHESPRRGDEFVTQKIAKWVKRTRESNQVLDINISKHINPLELGNLEARRDWGHAKDYVRGMHMILNQESRPMQDYVLGTGTTRSVREFVEIACQKGLGIDIEWRKDVDSVIERGVLKGTDITLVKSVRQFYRPLEVDVLIADPKKAREELRWVPEISFEELVEDMVR